MVDRSWIAAIAAASLVTYPLAVTEGYAAEQSAPLLFAADDTCQETSPTLTDDQRIVDQAAASFDQNRYQGLSEHLSELRAVADRAPACFPEILRRGSVIVMRGEPNSTMTLGILLAAATNNENVSVVNEPNTYPLALLLLASYCVETGQNETALQWLARGLNLQPNNQYLLFERAAALMALQRYEDAANLLQLMIDNPLLEITLEEARAYRSLGVVLIDLGRLDEAEAALNESIRIQPDNPGARGELEYIAQLRQGAQRRSLEIVRPGE